MIDQYSLCICSLRNFGTPTSKTMQPRERNPVATLMLRFRRMTNLRNPRRRRMKPVQPMMAKTLAPKCRMMMFRWIMMSRRSPETKWIEPRQEMKE